LLNDVSGTRAPQLTSRLAKDFQDVSAKNLYSDTLSLVWEKPAGGMQAGRGKQDDQNITKF
jgi:hypothetical protein